MCWWVWVGASRGEKGCMLTIPVTAGVDLAFPRGSAEGAVGGGTGVRCRADAGAVITAAACTCQVHLARQRGISSETGSRCILALCCAGPAALVLRAAELHPAAPRLGCAGLGSCETAKLSKDADSCGIELCFFNS